MCEIKSAILTVKANPESKIKLTRESENGFDEQKKGKMFRVYHSIMEVDLLWIWHSFGTS